MIKINTDEDRIHYLSKVMSLAFLIGLFISYKLWLSNRDFPLCPIFDFDFIQFHNKSLDTFFLSAFVLLLFLSVIYSNLIILGITILILSLFICQDINRLQPWVYIYFTFYLLIFISKLLKRNYLNSFQLVLIAIYFWSGIHKLNHNFIDITFQTILIDFFKIPANSITPELLHRGYIIPIIEILGAICLIFPKSRLYGIALNVVTHIFILIFLSPLGINYNQIVYPWNFAMIFFVLILFYKKSNFVFENIRSDLKSDWVRISILWLFGIMPIFNFIGFYDDYLSFSLYSDKNKRFFIAISDKYTNLLNHQFDDCLIELSANTEGGIVIDANKWALQELNVPIYPEYRVFSQVSQYFCKKNIPESDLIFLAYPQPMSNENMIKWTCNKALVPSKIN